MISNNKIIIRVLVKISACVVLFVSCIANAGKDSTFIPIVSPHLILNLGWLMYYKNII